MQEELEAVGFDTECLGGGRIFHDVEKRSIQVFGYSQVSYLSLFVVSQTFFFQNQNIDDLSLLGVIVVALQFLGKRLKLKMNKLLKKAGRCISGTRLLPISPASLLYELRYWLTKVVTWGSCPFKSRSSHVLDVGENSWHTSPARPDDSS